MILEETLLLRRHFKSQVTFEEAVELFNAVLNTPAGAVVEVGSACGGTTVVLIGAAEQIGKMVYSIDPYPENLEGKANEYTPGLMKEFREAFKKNILEGPWHNVIQFREDTASCIHLITDKLSVVFIDSCHELSFVKNEIMLLYPKLVVGGIIYIHDIVSERGQVSGTKESGLNNLPKFFSEKTEMFLHDSIGIIKFLSGRQMIFIKKGRGPF